MELTSTNYNFIHSAIKQWRKFIIIAIGRVRVLNVVKFANPCCFIAPDMALYNTGCLVLEFR